MLATLVALLAATAIAVPLTRRAGFGSVLGYLLAGVIIGPAVLGLITDVHQIADIASLGIVMLMFLIGLELRPRRLWVMRRSVLGLGTAQVAATAAAIFAATWAAGESWGAALVLGMGLAMSSTAIVLPMLAERDLLAGRAGRDGFAVLLFQDMSFIPIVALVPLLAGSAAMPHQVSWAQVGFGLATIGIILVGGRWVLPLVFRLIGGARTPEVFTATALLVVAGTAFLAEEARLSASLGAFMAGVLLSDSEYRHELETDIAPFEGLLLGFFFISVGMSADLGLATREPVMLVLGTIGLVAIKAVVCVALGAMAGQDAANRIRFGLSLAQGSEFSFILFAAAIPVGAMAPELASVATLIVAASMVLTPVIFAASERLLMPRLTRARPSAFDAIEPTEATVIIAGFGRVGQIVGRVLAMHNIPFTALERDPGQVDVVRRFGNKVYFGDPTRPGMLRAAGADQARLLVVALDDMEATLHVVDTARRHFPHLRIVVRARNRRHAHMLMERGIDTQVRDTFHSSLRMATMSLEALGIAPDAAARSVELFRDHDEQTLRDTQAMRGDERQLIQNSAQASQELAELFVADRARDAA